MKAKMQAETAVRKFIFPLILLIAAFSFPSNAIAEESEQKIRIAVIQDTPKLSLKTSTHTILVKEEKGAKFRLSSNETYEFKAENGKINMSGHRLASVLYFQAWKNKGQLQFGGNTFSGDVILRANNNGRLDIIEVLPIEKYLTGVLGSEMGAGWPMEALMAQAVASRSFALRQIHPEKPYDVTATITSQVFKSAANPERAIAIAVKNTEGQVLTYGNKILDAYFHSYCAGHTENPSKVWLGSKAETPKPLAGVKDSHCKKAPAKVRNIWSATVSSSLLLKMAKTKKAKVKKINSIALGKKDSSGRYPSITLKTDQGNVEISSNQLRMEAGPSKVKSTMFASIKKTKDGWTISGKGNGHGIGMCQWGAKAMAEKGKNYKQILKQYYPGAAIKKANEQ